MSGAAVPPHPGLAERLRTGFAAGRDAQLGAGLRSVQPGRSGRALPFRPERTQQDGSLHAGVLTTIEDGAAGFAAFTPMPADQRVRTVELEINLLAPACGARAFARGEVVRAGRTPTVTRAEVAARGRGRRSRLAFFWPRCQQATLIALRPAGAWPGGRGCRGRPATFGG